MFIETEIPINMSRLFLHLNIHQQKYNLQHPTCKITQHASTGTRITMVFRLYGLTKEQIELKNLSGKYHIALSESCTLPAR